MSRAKELRLKAGLSQTAAAALAKVAPQTWRLWEIDETLVAERKRSACAAVTPELERLARQHEVVA